MKPKQPSNNVSIVLLLLSMILSFQGYSQNITKVDSAIGTCIISNITPEQARKTAIIEAKSEALLKAGVSERVMVYSNLETFSSNDITIESFSSLTNIFRKGQIASWGILSERGFVNELNNFVYEVVINAKVIKYETMPDLNFSASISGLKPVYYEGESLEFNSVISQKSYVYVFLLNDQEISQLYPNTYEKEKVFDILTAHKFPTDDNIEYQLTLENNVTEKNTLIFVLTKEKSTPMVEKSEDLFTWLYLMEPNEVFYIIQPLNILKNHK